MDRSRIIVLAVAAIAAGAVALIARSLLGGGTPTTAAAPAPRVVMSSVLVAASELTPGTQLTPASLRWQDWPKSSVDPTFITQDASPSIAKIEQGAVVRAPMMPGEPVTATKIVHADAAGYLAARLMPGMRAVSISITVDTGAGGFILPNDHVDVLCTQQLGDAHKYRTTTVLKNIRVLAVDQTYESKDSKTVVARTATLELTPTQAELMERTKAGNTISLALRALGDTETAAAQTTPAPNNNSNSGEIAVIRYGVERSTVFGTKE